MCCLISGHLSLEPIQSLSPNSISGTLWRVEETFKTQICSIYSDNYSSLRESSLGVELAQFHRLHVTIGEIVERTPDLIFYTNVSSYIVMIPRTNHP